MTLYQCHLHDIYMTNQLLSFGSQSTLDFREKDVILKGLTLELGISALTSYTASTPYPNLNPAILWFLHIDLYIGGKIYQQIFGIEQFITKQLFQLDDERVIENSAMGLYSSSASRFTQFASSNYVYLDLWTMFNIADIHQV